MTAWITLSDVSIEAGCTRFIPSSHRGSVIAHHDSFAEGNLLSRGQEIGDVDESKAVFGALRLGEISLHHGRRFHASGPGRSIDCRIGFAFRYVTTGVRGDASGRDYAMLVRGLDAKRGWINIAGRRGLFAPADLTFYDQFLRDQSEVLAAGAEGLASLCGNGNKKETHQ